MESINPEWNEDPVIYEIERSMFYAKTLKILKLSRSALMYLTFLIYYEESQRENKNGKKLVVPIDFTKIDDKEKI